MCMHVCVHTCGSVSGSKAPELRDEALAWSWLIAQGQLRQVAHLICVYILLDIKKQYEGKTRAGLCVLYEAKIKLKIIKGSCSRGRAHLRCVYMCMLMCVCLCVWKCECERGFVCVCVRERLCICVSASRLHDTDVHYTVIGWPRPIECLKLQVIFSKRATKYRALLRKMTYQDKASYDSTPPSKRVYIIQRICCHTDYTDYTVIQIIRYTNMHASMQVNTCVCVYIGLCVWVCVCGYMCVYLC